MTQAVGLMCPGLARLLEETWGELASRAPVVPPTRGHC
jgi:hypothetical protein